MQSITKLTLEIMYTTFNAMEFAKIFLYQSTVHMNIMELN